MDKKNNTSLILIAISALLILGGIVITTIINNAQSNSTDIRAKASPETGVKYQAVVSEVNQDAGVITVSNVQPYNNPSNNFGQWNVTPPSGFNFASTPAGSEVIITVDSKTFNITTHTMTAKAMVRK